MKIVIAIVIGLAISFVFSLPVMWLWNGCLVGAVDGVHPITALQAFGIMMLFSLLFKSSMTSKD